MEHDNAMSPSGLPISNYTKQCYVSFYFYCVHVSVFVSLYLSVFVSVYVKSEKKRKFYAIVLMFS